MLLILVFIFRKDVDFSFFIPRIHNPNIIHFNKNLPLSIFFLHSLPFFFSSFIQRLSIQTRQHFLFVYLYFYYYIFENDYFVRWEVRIN